MPIPPFDANLVLPPHLGDPRDATQLSPYPCNMLEMCQRFASSPARREILSGLLRFRDLLRRAGFEGYQWLDGSFLEDVERREDRSPRDLDITTLYWKPDLSAQPSAIAGEPLLADHAAIKAEFHLDHYYLDVVYNPVLTVEYTRYWISLFSHRRDGIWKGMLRVDLATPSEDADAREYLRRLP